MDRAALIAALADGLLAPESGADHDTPAERRSIEDAPRDRLRCDDEAAPAAPAPAPSLH